jgi:diadenosine tetraphosphate (Ap4A) HIT family hydrolase
MVSPIITDLSHFNEKNKAMSFQLHPDLQRDGIILGSFPLSLLLLINDANYPWFVLVPQRVDMRDTIDLNEADHQALWAESAELGRTIMRIFKGEKLNVAALGNVTPQLHVHHIVRYSQDPVWPSPIWGKLALKPYAPHQLETIREKIYSAKMKHFM